MSDLDSSDSQISLTDKEKLQDAEDTIHELQHELEKLQLDMKQKDRADTNATTDTDTTTDAASIAALRQEMFTLQKEHDAKINELKLQITALQTQHAIEIQQLREEQQLQVLSHQENLEELGNLLKFRQQEQLDTLADFTSKLTEVGSIHQEAVQVLRERHSAELKEQKAQLLASGNKE